MKTEKTVQSAAALPKVVVIGGGTGGFTLLQALKDQPCDITAVVNMSDNGGSTGVIRDELDVLPPGDIRQCLVGLSEAPDMRELFNYRFNGGSLDGHSFGNLFLSTYEKTSGSFEQAVQAASELLKVKGHVLPVTTDKNDLVLTHPDGSEVVGEAEVGETQLATGEIPQFHLAPAAAITTKARDAILNADLVVIAPGNLYVSLGAALIVDGVKQALTQTKAPVAFVCNLVNRPKHTDGYTVSDTAREVERFIGKGNLDFVLYNNNLPTPDQQTVFGLAGETAIEIDEAAIKQADYTAIPGDFLFKRAPKVDHSTPVKHSFIRHDAVAVSEALMKLVP